MTKKTTHGDNRDEQPFTLTNGPSRRKKDLVGYDPPQATQKVLFGGLNCEPGQQDLFATDGVLPESDGPQ